MTVFAQNVTAPPGPMQLLLAAVLGSIGLFLLLPRPKGRRVAIGAFLSLAALAILGAYVAQSFGKPNSDQIGSLLFWFFSFGASVFGTALVCQTNPARGAIAFAFVIISVCGLFLTLAAPFLMAATIVVYAGAIIVTFLFVLMLSHSEGPSDENDRSREPVMAAIAGFAFVGLILFGLQGAAQSKATLPTPSLTADERYKLADVVTQLNGISGTTPIEIVKATDPVRSSLDQVLDQIENRYRFLKTPYPPPFAELSSQVELVRTKQKRIENGLLEPNVKMTERVGELSGQVRLLLGSAELPARNVSAIGLLLYSEYLLMVEMAGTLLLVATIGAVAIAQKKGATT